MLAIIPARGGSKGLPGKNIKVLNGKPLIAYTIEAALNSKHINRVIVTTDDEMIAEIATKFGAEIPFMRPDFLATDDAAAIDVYNYVLERLEHDEINVISEFVVLQPTSPLRTGEHIDEAIELFKMKNADSVISYCKESHPIFWHKFVTEEGNFEEIFQDNFVKNRQEIRSTFYPNGAIYIFNRELIKKGIYTNQNSFAYLMNSEYSVDIDTQEDWDYVEWILKKNNA